MNKLAVGTILFLSLVSCVPVAEPTGLILDDGQYDKSSTSTQDPFEMKQFFRMSDPRRAAEELRRSAIANGFDLDSIPPWSEELTKKKGAFCIRLPGKTMTPSRYESEFIDKMDSLSQVARSTEVVCILQSNRLLSLNETISLLERGVRIYGAVGGFAYLTKIAAGTIKGIMALPFVRWVGEYKAEYKYTIETEKPSYRTAYVVSLEGDRDEFRRGLEHIGVKVNRFCDGSGGCYHVDADWDMFPAIAELWWVKEVLMEFKMEMLSE